LENDKKIRKDILGVLIILGYIALLYTLSDTIAEIGVNTKILSASALAPLFIIFVIYLRCVDNERQNKELPYFSGTIGLISLFLVFVAFYCGITVFRFFAGLEIVESLHYAGIIVWQFRIVLLYCENRHLSKEVLMKNILLLTFMVDLFIVVGLHHKSFV
jgi:hypothetical protein